MARYTEKAILKTFEDMLETMPFDKITVSALSQKCDISPNTFYYHYKDIYELLEHWLETTSTNFLAGRPPEEKWDGVLKAIIIELKARPNVVYHIFDSVSRDYVEQYIYENMRMAIVHLAQKENEMSCLDLGDDIIDSIADICGYALLGFFLRFVGSKMSMDVEILIDQINRVFDTVVNVYMLSKKLNLK